MAMQQHSVHLLAYLCEHTNTAFAAAQLSKQLDIPSPRLSDILNVLTTAYIVTRDGSRYYHNGQSVADAFADFLTDNQSVGKNESIAEHTKTVCYYIYTHYHFASSKRTSAVIGVLAALKLIKKSATGWELCIRPRALRTVTMLTPADWEVNPQSLDGWDFSDFDV